LIIASANARGDLNIPSHLAYYVDHEYVECFLSLPFFLDPRYCLAGTGAGAPGKTSLGLQRHRGLASLVLDSLRAAKNTANWWISPKGRIHPTVVEMMTDRMEFRP